MNENKILDASLQNSEQLTMQRNIPNKGDFMKKQYSDLVYAYLQCVSYKGLDKNDNEVYFVYKNEATSSIIAKQTKIHGNSVKRRIKKLKDGNFIKEGKVWDSTHSTLLDAIILNHVEYYQKIPIDVLKFLINASNENVIKVYAYLLNRCLTVNKNYEYTYKELILNCFGMHSITNKRDYDMLKDIMTLLDKCNLIVTSPYKVTKYIDGQQTSYFKIIHYGTTIDYIDCLKK